MRTLLFAKVKAFSNEKRMRANNKICSILEQFLKPYAHLKIGFYYPLKTEVDLVDLMLSLNGAHVDLSLPSADDPQGQPMAFLPWKAGEPLTQSQIGFMGPSRGEGQIAVHPDIFLVPLVGFDRRGTRLGRGRGDFDRTLKAARAHKSCVVIGVAFALQECLQLPRASHDEPLDFVVTENELIEINPKALEQLK